MILSRKPSREPVWNKNTPLWQMLFHYFSFLCGVITKTTAHICNLPKPTKVKKKKEDKIQQENKSAIQNHWRLLETVSDTKSTADLGNMGVYCYKTSRREERKNMPCFPFPVALPRQMPWLCLAKYAPAWLKLLLLDGWKTVPVVQTALLPRCV